MPEADDDGGVAVGEVVGLFAVVEEVAGEQQRVAGAIAGQSVEIQAVFARDRVEPVILGMTSGLEVAGS